MTPAQAAQLVAVLHGAYPGTYFDGPVAEVFVNSLQSSDYDIANEVVTEWVQRVDRFPTVAELNGAIHRRRQSARDNELPRGNYATADREQAIAAFSRGYIRARTEAGESMEEIQPKLDRLLKQWFKTSAEQPIGTTP